MPFSLSDVYQLRQQLSNCALPLSDADFGIFASRLQALMASLDDGDQQYQQHQTTDAQPFPIADTPLRRSLLATFWRFVQLDWIQNKFKHLGHPLSSQICTFIFVSMRNATFTNDRIWFGGVSRIRTFASADLAAAHSEQRQRRHSSPIAAADDRTPMRQNSVAYFALGLTLIGFQENIEEIVPLDNLRQFLTKLDEMFVGSSNIFMDALLENDERCLQTMTAIQRINSNIFCTNSLDVSTALAPDILALSLLRKIHFDPLVVIDWVSSEPELSFVFLKQFSHRLAQLQPHELLQLCAVYIKMPNSESAVADECRFELVRQPTNSSTTTTAQQQNDDDHNFMHFEIEELHGQQIVRKSVAVPTKTNHLIHQRRHCTDCLPECSADELCQKVTTFSAELGQKLQKLAKKHLHFPAKSICANLQMFLDNSHPPGR
uniref:Uncharacterized protein n=1 Tax=Globodera rostochiensis TaxID=31243 RepID=A0A914HC49_GLORO